MDKPLLQHEGGPRRPRPGRWCVQRRSPRRQYSQRAFRVGADGGQVLGPKETDIYGGVRAAALLRGRRGGGRDRHGLLCCRITEHWAAARVVGLVCGKRAIADFDNAYARVGLAGAWRGRAALRR